MLSIRSRPSPSFLFPPLATVLIGGLILFVGCDTIGLSSDDPVDDLTYTIEDAQLTPGASATLRLRNGHSSPVTYDLCQSWAERQTSDGWIDADIRVADACILLARRSLAPGDTAFFSVQIDSSAAQGTYRFSTEVGIGDTDRSLFTGPFQIGAGEQ
jgi:hypothetical protein